MEVLLNLAARFTPSKGAVTNSISDKACTVNLFKHVSGGCAKKDESLPVDIRFENLKISVSLGFRKGMKQILHNVNGKFASGQFIAILGPSGAGKTTLLDILSGYNVKGFSGTVYNNDTVRDVQLFRKFSCYITQENHLQSFLTVWESMAIAADLKLGLYTSQENKDIIIKEILATLSLDTSSNMRVSCLSSGQQKRLAIAIELIDDPSVMFFDEPTTGIDSSSSTQCLRLLHRLARDGKTIVCTIHQASASALELFDEIYILGEGRCVYQGTSRNLLQFLDSVDLPCPKYNHPIEYLMELVSSENKQENITILTNKIENGKCDKWKHVPKVPMQSLDAIIVQKDIEDVFRNRKCERASSFHQFRVLSRRCMLRYKRDTRFVYMRFLANLSIAALYCILYWQIGWHGAKVRNNYNLLFCILIHNMVTTLILGILAATAEIPTITNEYFNKRYSLKMYFSATTVCEIPILLLCCLVFTAVVYPATGQPLEIERIAMFTTISLQLVLVSQSLGTAIGTALNVMYGTFLGFALSAMSVVLSNVGENLQNIPIIIYWISKSTFTRYGLEGMLNSIYGFNREIMYCPDDSYCHYKYPEKFMRDMEVPLNMFWQSFIVLCCNYLIFKIASFFLLKWRVSNRKCF
ncbi:hypothetical protein PPYR_07570 [Photinus pyralis]|uniref:ABC transporter domain-containing protein n=1 Tax=Photinus pyralis TaxID=7054 RepID=A0A1Y1KB77_PHOPY|nr:ATP-binding cassette sub-family G member 1-like [Photinus pyralis]KAB0799690.1 hypothetical protein PPYR_07570 [Photinus pyralis]